MEFLHSFIPVLMKYDFISQNYGPNVATVSEWEADDNAAMHATVVVVVLVIYLIAVTVGRRNEMVIYFGILVVAIVVVQFQLKT